MTAFTMPSNVFYRKYDHALPKIVRGDGIYLYDEAGNRYLDACGGAMVCNIGHGVAEVAEAIADQARTVAYVNGTAFTTEPVEALAGLLVSKAPAGLDRVYFLNSGSEAVEAALKLARQYHVERGEPQRRVVIAQTPGYHGNTLFALSASARAHYRTMFGPWLTDVVMIDAPYSYRSANREPATGVALERAIAQAGPRNVAAFIAEPIGGSSTGASVPPPEYFANVREICDRHGVIFICDEVLTGAGRTGTFFGIEHLRNAEGTSVVPDIITMGKGLNGGYAPLSAFITKAAIVEAVTGGSGSFMHAQTYSHNPLAAAAALAVQRYIEKHGLVERAARVGVQLGERLTRLQATIESPVAELIGDVRGIGMLWAMEFVRDRTSREALARDLKFAETLVEEAKRHGLVLWPNVGHADGTNGDLVMIAPAFSIEPQQIDELAELLQASLIATHRRVFKGAK
jgi:adenosylmethionine-8-amino-7-oxononanoate aminotransferase